MRGVCGMINDMSRFGWTLCGDRLPEEKWNNISDQVLVVVDYGYKKQVEISAYDHRNKTWTDIHHAYVIAWQNVPKISL